jgi:hypothetical protein
MRTKQKDGKVHDRVVKCITILHGNKSTHAAIARLAETLCSEETLVKDIKKVENLPYFFLTMMIVSHMSTSSQDVSTCSDAHEITPTS